MEKRSSHYKASSTQIVLINRVVVCKMYIGCCKSGTKLSWHADICVIVHKLAPRPSFGTMWRLLEKAFHIAVVVGL